MMFTATKAQMAQEEFHAGIYSAKIFHFEYNNAMLELVEFTRQFLEDAFYPHDPEYIHRHLTEDQQEESFANLQGRFAQSHDVRRLWGAVFNSIGLDPTNLACDDLYLRFQPHKDEAATSRGTFATATLGFHRDTWGTNVYAQTNWWAPLYPLTEGRTFAFYPTYWDKPLKNSTADYDFREIFRRGARCEIVTADEGMPHLTESIDQSSAVPVIIKPGSLLAFSGAHAHAGVPNHTGSTRISLETRTVWIDDFSSGRGAPNVDGAAPWIALQLFRRFSDGTPLHHILGLNGFEPYDARVPASNMG